jgi:mRNA interferase MazF
MVMQKGEVWWATLPDAVGSGPGGRRPVIIVQADRFTQSRIRTVIIVIVTSNLGLARAPGNVFLPQSVSGLDRDSVANISQVLTVDKTLLTDFIAILPDSLIYQIEEGLKLVFGLT